MHQSSVHLSWEPLRRSATNAAISATSCRLSIFFLVTSQGIDQEISGPQLFCLPMPVFFFSFLPQGGIWSSQSLTYLQIEGEEVNLRLGALCSDIKVSPGVPCPWWEVWTGCPVSMWAKSSSLQKGRHAGPERAWRLEGIKLP